MNIKQKRGIEGMFGKRGHRIDAVSQSDRARPIFSPPSLSRGREKSPGRCETARQWQLSHRRKAQLTVFIIIGLVLIVTAGLGIYLTSSKIKLEEKRAAIPAEQRPVYDFVVNCVQDRAREAINFMGQQGGYLEMPQEIARNPASYVPADPLGVVKIPYWYYREASMAPDITSMEKEISTFVEQNLRECLNEFADFPQNKITELGNVSATTTIAEANVVIELDYPISVESQGKIERIDSYTIAVPVRLKQAFELGQRFMLQENQKELLEQVTIDLMGINPDIPMEGLDFDCAQKTWTMSNVKAQLQTMLANNAQSLRISNTVYAPFADADSKYTALKQYAPEDIAPKELGGPGKVPKYTPPDAYEYFRMMLDIGQPGTDLRASFIYSADWGMDLDAQPSDNGILKSNVGKGSSKLLPFLCVNQYHFTYDAMYPIVLRIKDDSAFENTGFIFQFATPVIIDNNEGSRVAVAAKRFISADFPVEFCTTLKDNVIELSAEGLSEGYTEELNGAQMTFRCFSQLCSLGSTQSDYGAGARHLVTRLPEGCTNGFIVAEKEGYITTERQVTSEAEQEGALVIPMTALKTVNIKVVEHIYDGQTGIWQEPREIGESDNEAVSILLTAKVENEFGQEVESFEQQVEYPGQKTISLVLDNTNYDITLMLKLLDKLAGGYNAENMPIAFADVDGSDTIVFHVFNYVPQNWDDQYYTDVVSFLYTGDYQQTLKPEFETTGAIVE